jgi:hypothetical protein
MTHGELQRSVLPNWLRVLGVENRSLHSFVCSVYVRVGPRFEPPEQAGLSHFLEHMMLQGSERFPNSAAVLRSIEDVGGIVDAATYPEHIRFVFAVHRKHWRRVMEIAADVLLHPLFDADEIEREKLIIAQEVSQHRDKAGRNISPEEIAHCLLFHGRASESGTTAGSSCPRTWSSVWPGVWTSRRRAPNWPRGWGGWLGPPRRLRLRFRWPTVRAGVHGHSAARPRRCPSRNCC